MVYLEYEQCKLKYHEAQRRFDEILTEQERLFTKTQPNAIRYDKDNVQCNNHCNSLEEYMIAMEEKGIDTQLAQCRQMLEDRHKLLIIKEEELRNSHDKFDIIYLFKEVDGYSPHKIAKTLNYSISQVYRMLGQIQSIIKKDATKCEKKYVNIQSEKN